MSLAARPALALAPGWSAAADHPFCAIVRTWLRDGGDDPSRFECHDEGGAILWHMNVDPGMSLIVKFYEDQTGRVFFMIEAAVAKFAGEPGAAALEELLKFNRDVYEAFRVGLMSGGAVTCLARGRCEGITPEYFRRLLVDIVEFSRGVLTDLVEKHGAVVYREAVAVEGAAS